MKGSCLALGYYKDERRTKEVFINNPLQPDYPERVYKTGDLGSFCKDGTLLFHGRADRQIKHMGYRVELDEIEKTAAGLTGVESACCLYDAERENIWLFYLGSIAKKDLVRQLREKIPGYMAPRKYEKLAEMPITPSGKLARGVLKKYIESTEKNWDKEFVCTLMS